MRISPIPKSNLLRPRATNPVSLVGPHREAHPPMHKGGPSCSNPSGPGRAIPSILATAKRFWS